MTTVFALTPAVLATAGGTLAAALVATRLGHIGLIWAIRRIATKRLAGETTRWRWRTRIARPSETDEELAESRRQQRIEAIALALSRLATVVIWCTAAVALLHLHGISVSVAVGSAGFLGLILALGFQTSVNDYVTGLHVLLEDRFGEGDEVEVVTTSGRQLRGVVTGHGMFATRLHSDGATHHVANRNMCEVTNYSQLGVVTTLEVDHPVDRDTVAVAAAKAKASRPTMPSVVIAGVEPLEEGADTGPRSRIHLRAARALADTDQLHIGQQLRSMTDSDRRAGPLAH